MFDSDETTLRGRSSQWAIAGLAVLSLLSLIVTLWILADFRHEQQIVEHLTRHLPPADLPEANELAGELRLQSRLAVLLIVNLLASTVALALLIRAYLTSQRSLRNVRVVASDILASLDQGVITTDQQTAILSINPKGRELLEASEDGTEVALTRFPPDHSPLEEICREVLEKQNNIREWDYRLRKNGTERHLRAGCSLLQDHDGQHRGTVIHLRDVTEKVLMEQRLLRMERYMGLGSLAAGLQHEIKNPLSALSLHVQLLKEALDNDPQSATVEESLDVLNTEVRRINGVLESFRDFASVAELRRAEVNVPRLIQKIVKLTQPQARKQNIHLDVLLPDDPLPHISIDSIRIEQVLLNLILNSFAAMPEGGVMTIRAGCEADHLVIQVADTGGGIPDDLRDKVFDPYFTTRSTGTGMGLALSEKIVRQHDGTIDFQSSPSGTVFSVTIPYSET